MDFDPTKFTSDALDALISAMDELQETSPSHDDDLQGASHDDDLQVTSHDDLPIIQYDIETGSNTLLSIVNKLVRKVGLLEKELKDCKEKNNSRYKRHTDCILELQRGAYPVMKRQKN